MITTHTLHRRIPGVRSYTLQRISCSHPGLLCPCFPQEATAVASFLHVLPKVLCSFPQVVAFQSDVQHLYRCRRGWDSAGPGPLADAASRSDGPHRGSPPAPGPGRPRSSRPRRRPTSCCRGATLRPSPPPFPLLLLKRCHSCSPHVGRELPSPPAALFLVIAWPLQALAFWLQCRTM